MTYIALFAWLLPPALVAIYTYNYGRWAWKQHLRKGAIGLFLIALATVALPAFFLIAPH